ncbi:hypothetical protein GCM10010123_20280 [Pilimelia anulata]|uniref:Radical SAM core domain-containing protein n=1 Tax=Pilimelia anulata TaxID=53371 RepID=A0A8J3B5V4_9ACTN|nr:radical SAM protein [Pilimelia anulata]GGJ90389.1 hypothetical protein GCM10010123_20280 [Pilimelia anulata]
MRAVGQTKVRRSSAGIHLFDRLTGFNVLIDEVIGEPSEWSQAPRQVSVALTNACDLRCAYCYAPKESGRLRTEVLVGWMSELDEQGCIGVGFGGGEPTLVREFPDLCHRVADTTQLAVTFTTHGHHLDRQVCARLKGAVHFVRISMDGVGRTYERLRGRRFSHLLAGIGAVADITQFGINSVVNSDTVVELDRIVEVAERTGARELLLLPEQPTAARPGIDHQTIATMRKWVMSYDGRVPLVVSQTGAEGLPTCDQVPGEAPLEAYAHIDANGVLKCSSYDVSGVAIGADGVMSALRTLRGTNGGAP